MTLPEQELHDIVPSTSLAPGGGTAGNPSDVRHKTPYDQHEMVVLAFEPPTARGVLTQDGITQIAYHKYTPGTYTWLDTKLNPTWTALTNLLPLYVAPNLVTALGGLHCLASYTITTWYIMDPSTVASTIPTWAFLLNGYCNLVYYTLDCMDGKQARRTNSSSPLGQLFDHGVDCLCLLSHLSMVQAWLQAPPRLLLRIQGYLQFSFFCAQWEEYYTGVLPHATGNVGVTEVNIGLALLSLANAALSEEARKALYSASVAELVRGLVPSSSSRFVDVVVLPVLERGNVRELRDAMAVGWYFMIVLLVTFSVARVFRYVPTSQRLPAVFKLATPLFVWTAACSWIPEEVLRSHARTVSLAVGLACCLITIKLIVFSMARQAYAIIQLDALPVLVAIWMTTDPNWTPLGLCRLWQLLCLYYLYRIVTWNHAAIQQICQRMGIQLFVIKTERV
jgi:ethanolaminephosphotransferase